MRAVQIITGLVLSLLGGFIVLLLVFAFVQAQFLYRLRVHHPDIWRTVGQPCELPGASSNRWAISSRINHYFVVREFQSIADPVTQRLAERLWRVRRLFLGYALGAS